ncbi:hypothetical protein [Protaetiibacter mangrovi]|uniref:Uncharacterized protein n=1 Tax=Protaetiibacter mangrovi TaxID=2970926 RepID=A0ABT1ZJ37_9MICO|nr:hypothetical protein [Protaetiibacter mangrovi]MCS0500703.1 hypothetical protein [Protaetiibacter mangrovi]TPX03250.1 hypothetical protein FJ656_18190 [Schumannella luteola]
MTVHPSSRAQRMRVLAVVGVVGIAGFGAAVGSTAAAWVDEVPFGADASATSLDIWVRFSDSADWVDVGLPGDPDTLVVPLHLGDIAAATPDTSYLGDVFICNAGSADGTLVATDAYEVDAGGVRGDYLVPAGGIVASGVPVGTVIPAGSCPASPAGGGVPTDPPDDVVGTIALTTVDDFTGLYGVQTTVVLELTVQG